MYKVSHGDDIIIWCKFIFFFRLSLFYIKTYVILKKSFELFLRNILVFSIFLDIIYLFCLFTSRCTKLHTLQYSKYKCLLPDFVYDSN
jgi:hypothetical protein